MSGPRVIAFVHGELGRHALQVLGDRVVAAVINEGCDFRHGPLVDKPWSLAWLYADDPELEQMIADLKPTHGVSAGYRSILPKRIIDLFPNGIANVHTSLLPFGRGAHPNVWAIFLDQAAGVSLHLVDEGVDTGQVIAQMRVEKRGNDTARTLWERLQVEAKRLMSQMLPLWIERTDDCDLMPQAKTGWPTRRKADLETICVDGDTKYHGWELINILRARTFPPHPGALYTAPDGKRYRVTINIEEDIA